MLQFCSVKVLFIVGGVLKINLDYDKFYKIVVDFCVFTYRC